ncbi:SET domain protein, putative [Plasmodium sp. gorilla clade G3]|nr:SET domain protein, putative [Plasmodium sp. gorilla clade G3]
METIFRKLRRSSSKKKTQVEIDVVDERDWAQSKTLDLDSMPFSEDLFQYSNDKVHRNKKIVIDNLKREEPSQEDLYGYREHFWNEDNKKYERIKNINIKNEKIGINQREYSSRTNDEITNGSTDYVNNYYIQKKKTETDDFIYQSENKNIEFIYNGLNNYNVGETKEYSDVDEQEGHEEEEIINDENIDDENIDDENIDDDNINDDNIDDENLYDENVYDEHIYDENIDDENIDDENIDDENIDDENIDDENIYDENIYEENTYEENVNEENIYDEVIDNEVVDFKIVDNENADMEEVNMENVDMQYVDEENMYSEELEKKYINKENMNDVNVTLSNEKKKEKNILENDISDIKHKENDNIVVEEEEEYVEEKLDVYTIEEIDKDVEISNVKGKGRCMFTKKKLDPGSIIFVENPILIVTPNLNEQLWTYLNKLNDEQNFELPLKWHYAALCSITMLNDFNYKACLDKWVPEPDKEPDDDVYNVLDKVCEKTSFVNGNKYYYYKNKLIDPKIYSRIIQVWHYNAFGHHTDNEGLVLYNRISMLAHSCISTACWHYGENDSFVLRARIKLNPGDEITISYLGDDDLYKSSNIRREKLTNWLFVCMCSRCTHPVDNCRGFRCSTCGIGTFFIKSEYHDDIPIITKCNVCLCEITESTAYEYIEYENSYIERLQETDKTDLSDALAVFVQADKIFTQHWIMFQLYTILFEGYRDTSQWEKAIYYQMQRIKYAIDVIPRANYVLAWLYEELGEIHANSINTDILSTENDFTITFEEKKRICSHFLKSIHLLEILCGYSHDYLRDSLNKYYRIDSLTTTDAPQIEE